MIATDIPQTGILISATTAIWTFPGIWGTPLALLVQIVISHQFGLRIIILFRLESNRDEGRKVPT